MAANNAQVRDESLNPWLFKVVLSCDGGGTRGYSTLLIIKELMRLIAEYEASYSNGRSEESQPNRSGEQSGAATGGVLSGPLETSTSSSSPATHADSDLSIAAATNTTSTAVTSVARRQSAQNGETITTIEPPPTQNGQATTVDNAKSSEKRLPRPCHYFDYMSGTSTGGLIAIMLSRLRMTIEEAIEAYETLSDEVFGRPRWVHVRQKIPFFWWPRCKYNYQRLERVIQNVIEKSYPPEKGRPEDRDKFPSNPDLTRTIVVAIQKQDAEDRVYLFRSYDHLPRLAGPNEANPGRANNLDIVKIARATSAAPSYFKHLSIRGEVYIDGGFGANNPSSWTWAEVRQMSVPPPQQLAEGQRQPATDSAEPSQQPEAAHSRPKTKRPHMLISIGTGVKSISRFGSSGIPRYMRYMFAAHQFATDSEAVHRNMCHTIDKFEPDSIPVYNRFNCPGIGKIKLDDWSPKVRNSMRSKVENYFKQQYYRVDNNHSGNIHQTVRERLRVCARQLVELRRQRELDGRNRAFFYPGIDHDA